MVYTDTRRCLNPLKQVKSFGLLQLSILRLVL